jgi:hypothetical protein
MLTTIFNVLRKNEVVLLTTTTRTMFLASRLNESLEDRQKPFP